MAEAEDNCIAIDKLREQIKQLQLDREADRAKIGELQAGRADERIEIAGLQERADRVGVFLNKLRAERKEKPE
jgi:hypothetical protein